MDVFRTIPVLAAADALALIALPIIPPHPGKARPLSFVT